MWKLDERWLINSNTKTNCCQGTKCAENEVTSVVTLITFSLSSFYLANYPQSRTWHLTSNDLTFEKKNLCKYFLIFSILNTTSISTHFHNFVFLSLSRFVLFNSSEGRRTENYEQTKNPNEISLHVNISHLREFLPFFLVELSNQKENFFLSMWKFFGIVKRKIVSKFFLLSFCAWIFSLNLIFKANEDEEDFTTRWKMKISFRSSSCFVFPFSHLKLKFF